MPDRAVTIRKRRWGRAAVAGLPLLNAGLWALFPPPGAGGRQVVGEFTGSTVVILFSVSLLLAARARWLEPWFGGLDKMYRVHRRAGVVGFGLLVVHVALTPWRLSPGGGVPAGMLAAAGFAVMVALSVGPRVPLLRRVFAVSYGRWRLTHRFIGVFFIMSLAHMLLVDALVHTAPLPLTLLMVAYVAGILAFLYTMLLARLVRRRRPYVVDRVRRLDRTTLEIGLRPRRNRRLPYRSGQFVFVTFRRRGLREPHPFTVSGAPHEPLLRLTIKASGDFTRRLYRRVEAGVKVTVEGSYGMLDYRQGRRDQIWVAGGIGVTPFLSWCRDLTGDTAHDVDFFYTVREVEGALFWEEIEAVARRYPQLRTHLHVSSRAGTLTVARLAATSRCGLVDKEVYLCGPARMIESLARGLRRAGVPRAAIHFEEFSFR